MEVRPVGQTGLKVSLLGFGAAPLANLYRAVPESEAYDTVYAALEQGVTYFDTAPAYGAGVSETRLGVALSGVPRDQLTISTKVGRWFKPDGERVVDYSRDGVLRSLEASLSRLKMDYVDIVHIHDADHHYTEAIEEAYPVLDDLRSQGAIRAVSAGMNQWEMLADFATVGEFDCFMLAGRYTLLEQGALGFMDLCAQKGISILAAGVYNSGILATGVKPGAKYNYREAPPEITEKTLALEAACSRFDVPLSVAALQFPSGHPAVASLVIGCSSPSRIARNLEALAYDIPAELWETMRSENLIAPGVPLPDD